MASINQSLSKSIGQKGSLKDRLQDLDGQIANLGTKQEKSAAIDALKAQLSAERLSVESELANVELAIETTQNESTKSLIQRQDFTEHLAQKYNVSQDSSKSEASKTETKGRVNSNATGRHGNIYDRLGKLKEKSGLDRNAGRAADKDRDYIESEDDKKPKLKFL